MPRHVRDRLLHISDVCIALRGSYRVTCTGRLSSSRSRVQVYPSAGEPPYLPLYLPPSIQPQHTPQHLQPTPYGYIICFAPAPQDNVQMPLLVRSFVVLLLPSCDALLNAFDVSFVVYLFLFFITSQRPSFVCNNIFMYNYP